ncbi:exonuclease domain-containing protein [Litoribacter populi]|uniref:exonuclease domain-containing protein n=1 Tax=Litoribacter populi TaxID=2598460 RepID=UPI001F1BC443|nr:exonuclease domain-containing protein [Litoribacter populi]
MINRRLALPSEMVFAIVDIETTGGTAQRGGITEVAVIVHDGKQILDTFQTLVNPQRFVPGFITGLTGIDNEMVQDAPTFAEIAEELYSLLEDKVFVAHNVNFDYNFLHYEFGKVGLTFRRPKLCTVRLSRKAFPGHTSYSLGRLCESRGIRIKDRHRAYGDAAATAILFEQIFALDSSIIDSSLKRNSGEAFLPPHINKEKFDGLPQRPGVYYFFNKSNEVVYVGKAINIQSRFKGHFTGKSRNDLKSEIHDVSYTETGSEFLALLLEALEIKRLWPKYNRAQKWPSQSWGIYKYEDGNGYLRFQVGKVQKAVKPLMTFFSHAEAWAEVQNGVRTFGFCPKLAGIQKSPQECYDYPIGKCEGACIGKEMPDAYNLRINNWLNQFGLESKQLLIKSAGRTLDEKAAILFDNGVLKAYGFIDQDLEVHPEGIMDYLTPVKPVLETGLILRSFLSREKLDMTLI